MRFASLLFIAVVTGALSLSTPPDDTAVSESRPAIPQKQIGRPVKALTTKRVHRVSSEFLLTNATHIKIVGHPAALVPGTPAYDAWVIEVCRANGITVTESNLKQGRFWNARLGK